MNFSFYLLGTPNGNYAQCYFDSSSELFEQFAKNRQDDWQMIVYRSDQLIYYTYLRYGLLSKKGNEGAYFGMSMVFNGVCFSNTTGIFDLFEQLYSKIVSESEFIRKDKSGKDIFVIDKFVKKQVEIDKCKAFLHQNIEAKFDQINILDLSFSKKSDVPKVISIDNGNLNILETIRSFCCVIITNKNSTIFKPAAEIVIRNTISKTNEEKNRKTKSRIILAVICCMAVIATTIFITKNRNDQQPQITVSANLIIDTVQNKLFDLHGKKFFYSGPVKNGLPDGQGTAIYDSLTKDEEKGSIYTGTFKEGFREGNGHIVHPTWKEKYEGEYHQNEANGQGTYTFSNKKYLKGTFRNGTLNGMVVYYDSFNKEIPSKTGNYLNGRLQK